MYNVKTKAELEAALKNNEPNIFIFDEKIVKSFKPLDNVNISSAFRNRCKYTLEKSYDGSAFLGSFGFAPMISEVGDISFFSAMSMISSVGLHQILIIFSHYNIKFKDNGILLSKI